MLPNIVGGATLCQHTSDSGHDNVQNLKKIMFISWKFSKTQCNYAALVIEAFAIYRSVKRLSFFLQDAKCTILGDQKIPWEYFKGKRQNNKVNNWSIKLSSYKLETHYIKGTKMYWLTVKTCRQKN